MPVTMVPVRRMLPALCLVVVGSPVPTERGIEPEPAAPSVALPLAFEPNRGQHDPAVRFLARAPGYDLLLTRQAAIFAIDGEDGGTAVRMSLEGTGSLGGPEPLDPLAGTVNYLLGVPSAWHTSIPTYGVVRYESPLSGVELVFRSGEGGGLEYDLRLAPGVEPSGLGMRFEGAGGLRLDREGDLVVSTPQGDLVHGRPVGYQLTSQGRRPVAMSFRLEGSLVRVLVGRHDPALPLVIDPPVTLSWSTFLGGGGSDEANAVAVADDGAVYVTGSAASSLTPFPTTPGAFDTSMDGTTDAFVAKFMPGGDALEYATFLGGALNDSGRAIAVGDLDEAYLAGFTNDADPDFPTTPGAFDTTHNAENDAFLAKLDATGSALIYSTFLGGDDDDSVHGIAVDGSGAAFVGGQTFDGFMADFPTTPGAFDTTPGGGDGFAAKLNPAGSALVYSTFVGGSGFDLVNGIAVDAGGAAYVTGQGDDGFPTTPGAFDTSYNGDNEAFATKIAPDGGSLAYSTYLGGSGDDYADGIDVDVTGVAHVSGATGAGATPFPTTPGAFDASLDGPGDGFLARVSATGATLVHSTFLGGEGFDEAYAVAADGAGASHVSGEAGGATFPTTPGAFDTSFAGAGDAFAAIIDASGALAYSTFLGGSSGDEASGVAVAPSGATVVVGGAQDAPAPFPTTPGAFDQSHNGGDDAFVVELSTPYSCQGRPVTRLGSTVNDVLTGGKTGDVMLALGGKDTIRTRGGPDRVCAGEGNDTVNAGSGRDRVFGELGRDRLKGGGGNDRLNGGKGRDLCSGGGGTDKAPGCEKEKGIP